MILAALVIGLSGFLLRPIAGRGHWRIANLLSKFPQLAAVRVVVQLSPDSRIAVRMDDPYWSRLLSTSHTYEPEIFNFVELSRHLNFLFIDCGANAGFWSIILSGRAGGDRPCLAIEASPETYAELVENNALNTHRFHPLHKAVGRRSGDVVAIEGEETHHSARSIHPIAGTGAKQPGRPGRDHLVETISLDDAAQEFNSGSCDAVVIKLDVEGAEIDALKGATGLLGDDLIIIYEDHGKDARCAVSRFVMDHLGMQVFYDCGDGNFVRFESVDQVRSVKKQKSKGYNFFATKPDSVFFHALDSADAAGR